MYTATGKLDQQGTLERYYPTVRRHALSLQVRLPAGVELDDLVQAGLEGLLDALGRFDEQAGVAFSTFAHQRIRGAMIDELRSRDWLPRSVRRYARDIEQCIHRLQHDLGRQPEEREVATALGLELAEYQKLLSDTNNGLLLSYDEVVNDHNEPDTPNRAAGSPLSGLLQAEQQQLLAESIRALPEREQLLMALYYQEELNLKEIGAVMGVSESRVCQLHSQAVKRIKARIARESGE